jgi:hypothetical protein
VLDVFPFLLNGTVTLTLLRRDFCASFGFVRHVRRLASGLPFWFLLWSLSMMGVGDGIWCICFGFWRRFFVIVLSVVLVELYGLF